MPEPAIGYFKLPKLNLASPYFQSDPYQVYQYYRASEPVHWGTSPNPSLPGCWYLFNYSHVLAALKDPRLGRERPPSDLPPASFAVPDPDWLIYRDQPGHTGLRNWLKHALTSQLVEDFKPRLAEIALNLVESFPASGEV